MPPDDVGEFLKFLDDVSLQLACLLDIDGERDLKKIFNKQRVVSNVSKVKISKSNSVAASPIQANKRRLKHATSKQPTKARGRRKTKKDEDNHSEQIQINELNHPHRQQPQQQQQQHETHVSHESLAIKALGIEAETHSLEVQLSLGLTDELSVEQGASISPTTHLSPMEPSPLGQFNHSISQQHYFNPSRGALDSFHLHEEFSSHEPVPIPINDGSNQLIVSPEHQQHHHHHHPIVNHHSHQHHHHLSHSQPSSHIHGEHQRQSQESAASQPDQQQQSHLPNVSDGNYTTIPSMTDCYPQSSVIHHHGIQIHQHHHHHSQHQSSQRAHNHHQTNLQYHANLDQQWLSSPGLTGDTSIHILETHNHRGIDHGVPISPAPNQSLEHVQFGPSLYHHSYYSHQPEHLDPFNQITSDDFSANASNLVPDNNHMHRLQQGQQQHQQRTQHLNDADLSSDHYNHGHMNPNRSENDRLSNSGTNYNGDHDSSGQQGTSSHHSHSTHHHLAHMPHLVSSGIEPSNVIIQDINLASATWTSSEDLYSI